MQQQSFSSTKHANSALLFATLLHRMQIRSYRDFFSSHYYSIFCQNVSAMYYAILNRYYLLSACTHRSDYDFKTHSISTV